MRRYLRKAAALLSAAAVSVCNIMPFISEAAVLSQDKAADEITFSLSVPDSLSIDGEKDMLVPETMNTSESDELLTGDEEYPAKYDMRGVNPITSVKNQGGYGTCWAHSSIASAETSVIDRYPNIDLSEFHTAYCAYMGYDQVQTSLTDSSEIMSIGGNSEMVVNLWSQWLGPIDESKLRYGDVDLLDNYIELYGLKYDSDFHLENTYLFDYDRLRTNRDYVDSMVKHFVMNGQAVDVSFLSDSEKNYSKKWGSSNSIRPPRFSNHSVVIVGWDDDFPADHFVNKPEHNGAWLVKNSWGPDLGDGGFIWISYDDPSIGEFAVFELGDKNNYSTNFHHDTYIPSQSLSVFDSDEDNAPSYMANIFETSDAEHIEAISTYIREPDTEYEITVYTDLEDENDPASGTPSSVTKGVSHYTGYFTFPLDEAVPVAENAKFSVVVKLYNKETSYIIPLETAMYVVNDKTEVKTNISSNTTEDGIRTYTSAGESFYSADGETWEDVINGESVYGEEEEKSILDNLKENLYFGILDDEEEMQKADDKLSFYKQLFDEGTINVVLGNISLKAFGTKDTDVKFSVPSGAVERGTALELSSYSDYSINYCMMNYDLLGEAQLKYQDPITIDNPGYIDAFCDYKGAERIRVSYDLMKPAINDIFIYYVDKNGKEQYQKASFNEGEFNILLPGDVQQVQICPISADEVYLDQMKLENYAKSDPVDVGISSKGEEFILTAKREGYEDAEYIFSVRRECVTFDTENGTIIFNGADMVKDQNGIYLADGQPVSGRCGETLTAYVGSTPMYYVVPQRQELPDFEIDYKNETITGIPLDIAPKLEYRIYYSDSNSYSNDGEFLPAVNRINTFAVNEDGTEDKTHMAFSITPGEMLELRVKADATHFQSYEKVYQITLAINAPLELPEYTIKDGIVTFEDTDRYEIAVLNPVTEDLIDKLAQSRGYDKTDKFSKLMNKRYETNNSSELMSVLGAWWGEQEYHYKDRVAIRDKATNSRFASGVKIIDLYEKGDVNKDGFVDASDATTVLLHYAAQSTGEEGIIPEDLYYLADMDRDGALNSSDATLILVYYTELSTNSYKKQGDK